MSRRRRNGGDLQDFAQLCAYFALTIAAASFVFGGIVSWLGIGILPLIMTIVDVVGKVCLVIGIALPAYEFTRSKATAWQVVYWVALGVFALGCVFSFLPKIG